MSCFKKKEQRFPSTWGSDPRAQHWQRWACPRRKGGKENNTLRSVSGGRHQEWILHLSSRKDMEKLERAQEYGKLSLSGRPRQAPVYLVYRRRG